ncbi:hypothetical protein ACFQGK_13400 [Cellulomonas gelida]|uniref:Uncharacterized protein n=2 Tax=Cellulomonas gelida TaxID=1712 RepID=A0A4Y3KN71_9CELL|nr:hypothetical protein [Cellulomonas gelida]GEA84410.1 hypothetical protein CGE01nite_16610 [Cellulomonas gelida]GGL26470.1 hypothetical protein GCM10009774_16140 [Cellulomonas gelida]
MTAAPVTKKKAGHLVQQVPATIPTPSREFKMSAIMPDRATTREPVAVDFHYAWCDPRYCCRDDMWGDGLETGVLHCSAPLVWPGDPARPVSGQRGSVHVQRWRADWSEDETPLIAIVEPPDELAPESLAEYAYWLIDARWDFLRATTPRPAADAPCPEWCTKAQDQGQDVHEWQLQAGMVTATAPRWTRVHRGVVGRAWVEQLESTTPDGGTELRRRRAMGRVRAEDAG